MKNKDRIHDIHQRYYDVEKGEKLGDYQYKSGNNLSTVTNDDYLNQIS